MFHQPLVPGVVPQVVDGFPGVGGKIVLRFEVDAASAYPQRDGDSHATCSRPTLLAIANTPPVRMTSTNTKSGQVEAVDAGQLP
jgi:hypothetical protein